MIIWVTGFKWILDDFLTGRQNIIRQQQSFSGHSSNPNDHFQSKNSKINTFALV